MHLTAGVEGLRLSPGYLDRDGQADLLAAVRGVLEEAPLFVPRMPNRDDPSPCACRIAERSAGSPTKTDIAISPCIRTPAGRGRRFPPALLALWRELAHYPRPAGGLPDQFLRPERKNGPASGSRRERILTRRWSRFRSAIPACFGSAAGNETSLPGPSGSVPATLSSLAAPRGLPFTASIGFIRAHRACSRRVDGSI